MKAQENIIKNEKLEESLYISFDKMLQLPNAHSTYNRNRILDLLK